MILGSSPLQPDSLLVLNYKRARRARNVTQRKPCLETTPQKLQNKWTLRIRYVQNSGGMLRSLRRLSEGDWSSDGSDYSVTRGETWLEERRRHCTNTSEIGTAPCSEMWRSRWYHRPKAAGIEDSLRVGRVLRDELWRLYGATPSNLSLLLFLCFICLDFGFAFWGRPNWLRVPHIAKADLECLTLLLISADCRCAPQCILFKDAKSKVWLQLTLRQMF